ncbi:rhamnan synthesis F family protein [Microbacterium sp. P04]|uniref:rhamnan synthesis F family protein n=1 Tax=Microbacterium sp. P04 TaxID=3366947 RepID=UPI00374763EA
MVRWIVYATSRRLPGPDRSVVHALAALRPFASRLIVVHPGDLEGTSKDELVAIADTTVRAPGDRFSPSAYALALESLGPLDSVDEVVLTGDAWFGPVRDLGPVLERMDETGADFWNMVENVRGVRESFPEQGFSAVAQPWQWLAVRPALFLTVAWKDYWAQERTEYQQISQEVDFAAHFRALKFAGGEAFPVASFTSDDPSLFASEELLDAGHPFVDRAVFTSYPPFLDRNAVLGREISQTMGEYGYPLDLLWENLARTTAPKTIYANAGRLDVLPEVVTAYDPERPQRIAAIVHITDLNGTSEILERLEHLPTPLDVYVTTTEGTSAAKLEQRLEAWVEGTDRVYEVRVTPASFGRDMSDFFVAFRDILRSDRYDLVVKLHARHAWWKTVNRRRYFRRYQLENLLSSAGYARNVIGMFQAEPGLGLVFPPMINIGYSTMGNGWSYLREPAEALAARLGINVPFDSVSPLAPYGGMWVARPEALRLMVDVGWRFVDYSRRYDRKYRSLARLQERMVTYAAGELGYHSRTVMNAEHVAISHTAVDFKLDQFLSTTHGWPVQQIQLLHRAGYTGYGGPVALVRMYLRLHHPRVVRTLGPLYRLAYKVYGPVASARRVLGRLRPQKSEGE